MKIQFHNIAKSKAFNIGIGYLHDEKIFALGLLFFSITISWAKELKEQ